MRQKSTFLRTVMSFAVCCLVVGVVAYAHDGDDASIGNADPPPGRGESSGPFESSGVILLGHLELEELGGGGSVLGNDCWGWTHAASGRKFAIMGLTNAASFVEVTDPTNPLYLGKLDTAEAGQNRAWRDMKVYDDHAFIVADGSGNDQGVQVFDLTELLTADPASPQSFTALSHYTGFGPCHNIEINVETGYGYAVGCSNFNAAGRYRSGGLVILDLSDPTNITEAGFFSADGYTHDAQAVIYTGPDADHSGSEIVFASNEDTLTIVDVSDKSNTTQISRLGYPERGYSHQGWLSADQQYFYMDDELDERNHIRGPDGVVGNDDDLEPFPTRTHIWDVRDLDNPVYVGFHEGVERTVDHNLYVKGQFMYQANYTAGLRILKIDSEDPTSLEEFGFFDTFAPNNATPSFNGAWSCFPFFDYGDDDVILISDRQGGLFVVQRLPEPVITDIVFDAEDNQRSSLDSLSLVFEGEIEFGEGAFSLIQRSTAIAETFVPVAINVNESFDGTETTATIQFDSHVRNSENALVDGNYQLTLVADLVTRQGVPLGEDFVFGDVEEDGFFARYGDSNGDRVVNVVDLLAFRNTFNAFTGDANYNIDLDFDGGGLVNVIDLLQFRDRFGTTLPFTFGSSGSFRSSLKLSPTSEAKPTASTTTKTLGR